MESGTSLCLWALNRRARTTAFETGKALGVLTTNSTNLVEQLRSVDAKTLQATSYNISVLVCKTHK